LLGGSKVHDYRTLLFLCSEVSHFVLESKGITRRSRGIPHAWHFGFESGLVFTASKLGVVVAWLTP
ncbi:hypothetical protein, partial [Vibrio vulnificus]|uniref:hypothetical protein n=1 Tax=Vibrio vulnificus TaxID=672 RepID=UPI0019D4BCED